MNCNPTVPKSLTKSVNKWRVTSNDISVQKILHPEVILLRLYFVNEVRRRRYGANDVKIPQGFDACDIGCWMRAKAVDRR